MTDALSRIAELRDAHDYRGAIEAAEQAVRELRARPARRLAAILIELGKLQEEAGRYGDAERTLERAARLAAEASSDGDRARALALLGFVLWPQGRHAQAERHLNEALAGSERAHGPEGFGRWEVLVHAAKLRQELGQHGEAESLARRAVTAAEAGSGRESDRARAVALDAIASSLRAQGRYEDALPVFYEALELAERAFGARSLEVGNVLNDLGILCKFSGRFDEGLGYYRRSLAILEDAFGEEHPDVASLYHNLGGLEHTRGDFEAAEPYARKSVEIRERTLGPDHLHVVYDRAAWASILDGLGRSEEAEEILREAVRRLEEVHGAEHHEIAVNLNNIAAIRQRAGDFDEAEALYRRSLAIKERLLDESSPELGTGLNNLGLLLKKRGRLDEAEAMYRRAIEIYEAGLQEGHPNLEAARANLHTLLQVRQRASDGSGDVSGT